MTGVNGMPGLPLVYLETSFISYLTARPSRDVGMLANQQITQDRHRATGARHGVQYPHPGRVGEAREPARVGRGGIPVQHGVHRSIIDHNRWLRPVG